MAKPELTQNKVAILAGGWSDEAPISMESGRNVERALHEVGFTQVEVLNVADDGFVTTLANGGYDVAFVAMHGHYGEDGCIQGLLEILHLPYTFSGVLASAVATDKSVAKTVCSAAGITLPRGMTVAHDAVLTPKDVSTLEDTLGYPMFVKPASNGSSFGVSRVTAARQLQDAVDMAGAGGDDVLIEECIEGIEITVPVVGTAKPYALPIVEIVFDADFYDVTVKYEAGALHHVIPARLPEDVYRRAEEMGIAAHKALGCRGVSRTDLIVKDDGTPVMLETNMVPGMTERSLLPDAAARAGIGFPELCKRFVQDALDECDARTPR